MEIFPGDFSSIRIRSTAAPIYMHKACQIF
jgi:hypothetical protein